jgi:hypothetical protein
MNRNAVRNGNGSYKASHGHEVNSRVIKEIVWYETMKKCVA